MKSAAERVGFTVSFGFVMLFAVLVETVMTTDRTSERVEVVPALRRSFRLFTSAVPPVNLLDELGMRLVAVFALGVGLRALLPALSFAHVDLAK
jgi:uncharacterized membrane protein